MPLTVPEPIVATMLEGMPGLAGAGAMTMGAMPKPAPTVEMEMVVLRAPPTTACQVEPPRLALIVVVPWTQPAEEPVMTAPMTQPVRFATRRLNPSLRTYSRPPGAMLPPVMVRHVPVIGSSSWTIV